MKKRKFFVIIVLMIFVFGCRKKDMDLPSTFPKLNGTYCYDSYTHHGKMAYLKFPDTIHGVLTTQERLGILL
ncbi:MAG: hypothetical protein B7C24_15720 [Bacteroidetes bacterium 4572_77]|nr:MAG: hypothetical protein B7C24_15720 [Bacteroidetes bacterium 4572_77]